MGYRLNGKPIHPVGQGFYPEGKWMIVWDHKVSPDTVYLRKVYAILPKCLDVGYPVYAAGKSGYSYTCWTYAAEIPKGMDVSNLAGYNIMMEDLKNGQPGN